jgi:multifunctional beta-oxidation protein
MDNFNNVSPTSSGTDGDASSDNFIDSEDTKEVKEAKSYLPEPTEFEYTERDVLLYNLGVGAKADELQWTYENSDGFQVCRLSPSAVPRSSAVLECFGALWQES